MDMQHAELVNYFYQLDSRQRNSINPNHTGIKNFLELLGGILCNIFPITHW